MRDPGDRAHRTPPDPTGPGFPSSTTRKHLSNSHSKLKLDGTREIPSKSINRFINTRWYYRLRQKHLQPCPEAAGSVLPKPTGPRLRPPSRISAPGCPRPRPPQTPAPQSGRGHRTPRSRPQGAMKARSGHVGARRPQGKSAPGPCAVPVPRPRLSPQERSVLVNTPAEECR